VAEQRSEHADVVAAPEAAADHGTFVDLCPVQFVLDVAVQFGVADADDRNFSCGQIEVSGIARLVDRLRVDDVEPQAVIQRQLVGRAPGRFR
jgi:hypothetical protein